MVPISVRYTGELRCTAQHDNSGIRIITDAPRDNAGRGESFSPTDLVATALGTCMITTIGIVMKKKNLTVPLDGTAIAIEKHMSSTPPRKIAKIVLRLTFPAGIAEEYRPLIRETGDHCPVALSLHPDLLLEVQYLFPD